MSNPTEVLNALKASNQKAFDALKREFSKVRAGKASASILDNVRVNYYGTLTPLNQMSTVSTPDARTIVVAPWDATALADIEKAIIQAEIGYHPQNDGKIVRISIPPLTEERRKELTKVVNRLGEEAKIAIRQHRKDGNEAIKNLEKAKALSEDESKKQQEQIQKVIDEATKSVDELVSRKTAEIMTI